MRHHTPVHVLPLFAAAVALAALPGQSSAAEAVGSTVHVLESAESDVSFDNLIKAALSKWKVPLILTNDPEQADYILGSAGSHRKTKWHEGLLTQRGETSRASVELSDRCGNIAWIESAGDRSLFMDSLVGPFAKNGPKKVADRIAKRLKKALRSGNVLPPAAKCADTGNEERASLGDEQ